MSVPLVVDLVHYNLVFLTMLALLASSFPVPFFKTPSKTARIQMFWMSYVTIFLIVFSLLIPMRIGPHSFYLPQGFFKRPFYLHFGSVFTLTSFSFPSVPLVPNILLTSFSTAPISFKAVLAICNVIWMNSAACLFLTPSGWTFFNGLVSCNLQLHPAMFICRKWPLVTYGQIWQPFLDKAYRICFSRCKDYLFYLFVW